MSSYAATIELIEKKIQIQTEEYTKLLEEKEKHFEEPDNSSI